MQVIHWYLGVNLANLSEPKGKQKQSEWTRFSFIRETRKGLLFTTIHLQDQTRLQSGQAWSLKMGFPWCVQISMLQASSLRYFLP